MRSIPILIFLLSTTVFGQWTTQTSHTTESLRGVSAVSEKVVWASGTHGTYLRTVDGGTTWLPAQVPGAELLDFRDVEAFSADLAYLLAAGPGDQSRIYKTTDGGHHWVLQFTNPDAKGFLDCMAFWDRGHGMIVGDPVDGKFTLLTTSDGGAHWSKLPSASIPIAIDGEGAFAASGSCIATQGKTNVWFGTGGTVARVFRSHDRGQTWSVAETPIQHGVASAGIFSLTFADAKHGVIAGGDYKQPRNSRTTLAVTKDGGATWTLRSSPQQAYLSAVTYIPHAGHLLIAVGTSFSALMTDNEGASGYQTDDGFNAVSAYRAGFAWAVGANGKVGRGLADHCPTCTSK